MQKVKAVRELPNGAAKRLKKTCSVKFLNHLSRRTENIHRKDEDVSDYAPTDTKFKEAANKEA